MHRDVIMNVTRKALGCAGVAAAVLALASCANDQLFGGGSDRENGATVVEPPAAAPTGKVASAPLAGPVAVGGTGGKSQPAPVDMAGRWELNASGGGSCGMTFTVSPTSADGSIAPEGGCPGDFFTSRGWVYQTGGLVIRDHTGAPLAQLAMTAPGRFEGKAVSGLDVSLTR